VKLTQVAARGVRVNSVNPGVITTQIFTRSGMDPAAASQYFQDSKVFIMKEIAGMNGYVVFKNMPRISAKQPWS
jgi:hypothetical protein